MNACPEHCTECDEPLNDESCDPCTLCDACRLAVGACADCCERRWQIEDDERAERARAWEVGK